MDRNIKQHIYKKLILISCIICLMTGCQKDSQSDSTGLQVVEDQSNSHSEEESNQENNEEKSVETVEDKVPEKEQQKEEASSSNIAVYICGQIQQEGVYELPKESRICDLIDMAGGFTNEAMETYLNQAKILVDGEKIYVPTVEEVETGVVTGSGVAEQSMGDTSSGMVNINTATRDQLMTITGIGEAKADSIIQYREEHGGFQKPEDIQNITGIKAGVYEKIKNEITT